MTDAQRRTAIEALIEKRTAEMVQSKAKARESLLATGIYTTKGALRVEFGGESKKDKAAA